MTVQKYYKFLGENLASLYDPDFFYPTPTFKNGGWIPSKWIKVERYDKNGEPCGRGLHLMKKLIPKYGRFTGNVYEAEGDGLLGEDEDKARFKRIRLLRPIPRSEIFKPNADLSNADLSNANLSNANLSNANLSNAKNLEAVRNPDKAYWNKFTKVSDDFKKLLSKDRFLDS